MYKKNKSKKQKATPVKDSDRCVEVEVAFHCVLFVSRGYIKEAEHATENHETGSEGGYCYIPT